MDLERRRQSEAPGATLAGRRFGAYDMRSLLDAGGMGKSTRRTIHAPG